jgi:hypothetical protein
MSQFGASLTDDARVIIYDRNMFIIQATDLPSLNQIYPVFHHDLIKVILIL